MIRDSVGAWLARHRKNRLVSSADHWAQLYHRAVANHTYDHDRNGEAWVLDRCTAVASGVVFDVGANVGTWSSLVRERYPTCDLHCFEPTPTAYARLVESLAGQGCTLNQVGLSDVESSLELRHFPERSELSTFTDFMHGSDYEIIEVPTRRGADYCDSMGISRIDLLKIDTEGSEPQVLAGFEPMFVSGQIDVVQFEYGLGSIATRFLLADYYEFFESLGYLVGKIYPGGVEFTEYRYDLEDFLGPNYLAVRGDCPALVRRLSDPAEGV